MKKLFTIRTVQAAGRRRRRVLVRSRGVDFCPGFGANGSVSTLVPFYDLQNSEKDAVTLQLTVQAVRARRVKR